MHVVEQIISDSVPFTTSMQAFDTRAHKVSAQKEADVANKSSSTGSIFIHNNLKKTICNFLQNFQGNVAAHVYRHKLIINELLHKTGRILREPSGI